ncbi:UNVERIFIED_CONTAM: Kinesin-like protein KIN-12E [Sesamum radiatum]|uniref:Kinesin-like protein KIN-12E n=1 Tax=Sesamum radiatum TaxID=300843 RepID=A0AAW2WAD2_SESRA
MPLFSESTTSAVKTRFGYHQNQQPEAADSGLALMKSSSTPDLFSKSASRDGFLLQSSCKDKSSKPDDGETTSCPATRSFEFREDPNFWKEHNVQVIIRLRPLSGSEISLQGHSRCVRQESSQTITWTGHPESRFTFDLVADENVSQEMLFKVAGLPMVENCVEGYNSCMFAYGQTGSGKTHTMLGDIEGGARRHSVNCGMTPRVFEYLFSRIQKEKDVRREEKLKFTCRCSFLEIYNEQILDLLDPSSVNLQIREDSKKGIYVENVTEVEVSSARDVIQQLIQGAANRKVAATNMNRASSRSHSVFTCIIESKWESQGVTHHRFARLNLVDLAGSERQKSSGAEGERLKEATNINKSLSTLGLVIMNLVSISNGKSQHVPYRDSKLTFLLQSDSNFLSSNQEPSSPWRTSINEENEFLRMQAIQNQSELDSLRKRLDFCVGEKEKLERHVNDLAKELEAERLSKEALAEEAQKGQTKLLSLMNVTNVGQSETELKTMVDAIAAASQREAEAHEMAIFLSKENDELRMKLKVLIEDNNKLIDLYERAVAENSKNISDSSLNPQNDTIEDQNYHLTKVAEEKEQEMQGELEKLKCQLMEMHEENDKLLSLYEKAMQERDEFKRVIVSGQHKNVDDEKGDLTCPEKLVEVDGGQCLGSGEASLSFENEYEREETDSVGPHVVDEKDLHSEDHPVPISESLLVESCLYEVHVQDDCSQRLIDSQTSNYSDSGEAHRTSLAEIVRSDMPNSIEQNGMEIDELNEPEEQEESYKLTVNTSIQTFDASAESNEYDQDGHMNIVDPTAGTNLEIQENPPNTIAVHVCKDLSSIREKLVEAQEKLSYSAQTVTMFGSLERAMIEVDALSEKIGKLEVSYFEQREALARSRFNASSEHLTRKKEELTRLQLSRQKVMDALSKIKQVKTELEDSLENLRSKVEEENRKLESERVLFAIDNVEKPASELSQRNWQVTGNATALLKSEEEKTKLQNQIKLNKEKLRDVKKEAEAMTGKLGKIENEIQVLEVEVQKETLSVQEMNRKLQSIVREKEMLLEVQKHGKDEFESMILEYHQSLFEADLKEDETKIMHEELLMESQEIEDLQRAKAEATRRKAELLEAISCNTSFVSDKVEADLHNIRTSVVELNSMLELCGSMESQFSVNL